MFSIRFPALPDKMAPYIDLLAWGVGSVKPTETESQPTEEQTIKNIAYKYSE